MKMKSIVSVLVLVFGICVSGFCSNYKAILTNISDLDNNGNVTVTFDTFKGTSLLSHDNMVNGLPINIVDMITQYLRNVQDQQNALAGLTIGATIRLP
jgi:hypothetical protein